MPTQSKPSPPDRKWWKSAVVYQIYPSSFKDSNNDGIGDLNGIHSKLDYLKDLGVDVVWLSPIYKSPQADMGYDISDYRDIDPRYGTLEDWDRLVRGIHDRGMKIMMDLVVNHSSDEHQWFKASRSSKEDPKRDWYIWRPPKYDEDGNKKEPNNWKAQFQGSAWDFDEKTQEYYLHLYLPGQPDLNWENEEVRGAVWEMMSWWLDRGVDGFRMDVINLISKVPGLPDAPITNPKDPYQPATEFYTNGPRVHEYIKEMNRRVLSQHNPLPLTVGETPMTHNMNDLAQFVLPANKELDMVFQFEIMEIDGAREGSPRAVAPGLTQLPIPQDIEAKKYDCQALKPRIWKLTEFKEIINRWQNHLRSEGFWNSVYLENHDHSRSVSRFGQTSTPLLRTLSAKMLAMLQIGQGGTIYVYQGEEIGMGNVPQSWGIEEYKDAATQRWYEVKLKERMEEAGTNNPEDIDMSDIMDGIQKKARDHARTPVQWDETAHAGFTSPNSEPWMRVNDDYKEWNVANQLTDINSSVLGFWREALKARKTWDVLVYGEFKLIPSLESDERIFAFIRHLPTESSHSALIILNFSAEPVQVNLHTNEISALIGQATGEVKEFKLILRNYGDDFETKRIVTEKDQVVRLDLEPYEGLIYVNY